MPLIQSYYFDLRKLPAEVVYATYCNTIGECINFSKLKENNFKQEFLTIVDRFGLEKIEFKINTLNAEYKKEFKEVLQSNQNTEEEQCYSYKLSSCRDKYKALYYKLLKQKVSNDKFYLTIKENMDKYILGGKRLNLINENGLIFIVIKGSVICVNSKMMVPKVEEIFNKQLHKDDYKQIMAELFDRGETKEQIVE